MKKGIIFILLFVVSLSLIIANPIKAEKEKIVSQPASQIAYVDMQRLFQNHPQKKASEQKLEVEAKKLKQELKTRGKTMDKEERQELLQKYQGQLNQQEQELVEEVLADINEKINKIAKENNVSVVLDKSAVIYGGQNLTAKVLSAIKEDYEESTTAENKQNNSNEETDDSNSK